MKEQGRYLLFIISIILISTQAYSQAVWTQIANFGGGAVTEDRAFGIGNKGYVGTTSAGFWEYDPVTDTWTQKASFIGPNRLSAVGFSIGTKGYFGTGGSFDDFYEYDQATNNWTQKANFGGSGREGAVGCAIDGKGYLGTGGSYMKDWWEYDPVTDTWTQKADLAGPTRYHGGAFAIGSKGYVCTGFNGSFFNDLWEFDPVLNTWTVKASLPGQTRDRPVGLAANGKGYIISGWTGSQALNDAWEYDPVNDSWTQIPSFPGTARYNSCGFVAGNNLYFGSGWAGGPSSDFYEYGISCNVQVTSGQTTCPGDCDGSASVSFPVTGATYVWSTGATSNSIQNVCAGSYTVSVTDSAGCTAVLPVQVEDPLPITATAVVDQPTCFGDLDGGLCAVPSGGTPPYTSFLWSTGDTSDCIVNYPAGTYSVIITDSSGCVDSISLILTQSAAISFTFSMNPASCATCPDGFASVGIAGGATPFIYSWSNGDTLSYINNVLPGTYNLCVTDANGCSHCDTVDVTFTIGIAEPDNTADLFTVAPNPVEDELKIIAVTSGINVTRVDFMDVHGKHERSYESVPDSELKFDVSGLPAGIYLIRIHTGSGILFSRFIKMNSD